MNKFIAKINSTYKVYKCTTENKIFKNKQIPFKKGRPSSNRKIECKPGIYDKDTISRVLKCGFNKSIESEIEKLNSRELFEEETTHHTINNAIIAGGKIFTENGFYNFSKKSSLEIIFQDIECYEEATILNTTQGLRYFGHWLRDDCALYEKIRNEKNTISLVREKWPDCNYYEKIFEQTWNEISFAYIKKLNFYRDLSFSLDKANRLNHLREKIRSQETPSNKDKIIYISRGDFGDDRDMENRIEVERAFINAGIKVIEPAKEKKSLVPEILDASIIISIEGSQLSHAVYSIAKKGSIIVLQPPERFYNPHIEWCRLLDINYGIVIGEKRGNRFFIDPAEVFRMINTIQKST